MKFNFALNGITGDTELLDVIIIFKGVNKDGNEVNLNDFTGHLKNTTFDEYAIKATMAIHQ